MSKENKEELKSTASNNSVERVNMDDDDIVESKAEGTQQPQALPSPIPESTVTLSRSLRMDDDDDYIFGTRLPPIIETIESSQPPQGAGPTNLPRVSMLDDDDDDGSGGLSQEEQWRLEERDIKARAASASPKRTAVVPALAIGSFAKDGHFISKTDIPAWRTFDFVVKDLGIAVGPPTLLIAASYSGKSFLLQHLALCAVTNKKFLDTFEVKQGNVLHLDYEQGTDQSEVRYQRLMNGHGITDAELRKGALLFARPTMPLDSPDAEKELESLTKGYSLCIIDSYRAALSQTDENSSEARGPLTMLGNVSEKTGCVFIVIHHQGRARHRAGSEHGEEGRAQSSMPQARSSA